MEVKCIFATVPQGRLRNSDRIWTLSASENTVRMSYIIKEVCDELIIQQAVSPAFKEKQWLHTSQGNECLATVSQGGRSLKDRDILSNSDYQCEGDIISVGNILIQRKPVHTVGQGQR